jgi:hypothetical protein
MRRFDITQKMKTGIKPGLGKRPEAERAKQSVAVLNLVAC